VESHLTRLVGTGLYGKNTAEAVERLVARRLEDLLQDGFFERFNGRAGARERPAVHSKNRSRSRGGRE